MIYIAGNFRKKKREYILTSTTQYIDVIQLKINLVIRKYFASISESYLLYPEQIRHRRGLSERLRNKIFTNKDARVTALRKNCVYDENHRAHAINIFQIYHNIIHIIINI